MEINEFAKKVCKAIEKELGESYKTELKEVTKNNGVVLLGLMIIRPKQNVVPTIYLNHFWQAYEEGTPLSAIVTRLIRIYWEETPETNIDMGFFADYEKVKDRICYRLINKERNEKQLEELPYIDFFDLAICFFYAYEGRELGEGSILIKQSHLDTWKVGISELFERANINTPRLFPWECQSMDTLLGEAQGVLQEGNLKLVLEEVPLQVLSNTKRLFGAGCILYPGLMERLALEHGGNYFILPSSVHEIILLKDTGEEDVQSLKNMVRQINQEFVDLEEVLSDNVYYYEFAQRVIKKIN